MRRISARYAKPGMVLGWPVFDSNGGQVYGAGEELDQGALARLRIYGVGELLVEDPRVEDVPVEPLIQPADEATLVQVLEQILMEARESGLLVAELVQEAARVLASIRQTLSDSILGEPSAGGCLTPERYDYAHPARVAGLSTVIGMAAGLSGPDLASLGLASLLMNIGYAKLPEGMLDRAGPLPPEAWREVVRHPALGAEIARACDAVDPGVPAIIAQSHERWDGTGYDGGAKGEEIALTARILGLVDTYYALVSQRPHRGPFLPHEAIEFIMAYSDELFDPAVVAFFVRKVPLYPTGIMVRLNTGESGIVTDANPGFVGRPVVRICVDQKQREVKRPYDLDLARSDNQERLIVQVLDY